MHFYKPVLLFKIDCRLLILIRLSFVIFSPSPSLIVSMSIERADEQMEILEDNNPESIVYGRVH